MPGGGNTLKRNFQENKFTEFLVKPKNKDHVSRLWIFCVLPLWNSRVHLFKFTPRVWEGHISGELGAYMEETVRRVTPRTSLRSVLRQQAVGRFKIFLNPRAHIEGGKRLSLWAYVLSAYSPCYLGRSREFTGRAWSLYGGDRRVTPRTSARAWNSPRVYTEAELGIFPSPRA